MLPFFWRRVVEEDLQYAEQLQSISIFILVLVLIISPILIFLVHNATQTIQVYCCRYWFALPLKPVKRIATNQRLLLSVTVVQAFASGLLTKTSELKRERQRCDRLLCQMLPKAVVKQLKQKKQVWHSKPFKRNWKKPENEISASNLKNQ